MVQVDALPPLPVLGLAGKHWRIPFTQVHVLVPSVVSEPDACAVVFFGLVEMAL